MAVGVRIPRRLKRQHRGWVAAFCPSCRDARPFRLAFVTTARMEMLCGECGLVLREHFGHFSNAAESPDAVEIDDELRCLVEQERKLRETELDHISKERALHDTLQTFEELAQAEMHKLKREPAVPVVLGAVVVLLVWLAGYWLGSGWWGLAAAAATIPLLAYWRRTALRRFVRGPLQRYLYRALHPLEPEPADVEAVMVPGGLVRRWIDPATLC